MSNERGTQRRATPAPPAHPGDAVRPAGPGTSPPPALPTSIPQGDLVITREDAAYALGFMRGHETAHSAKPLYSVDDPKPIIPYYIDAAVHQGVSWFLLTVAACGCALTVALFAKLLIRWWGT